MISKTIMGAAMLALTQARHNKGYDIDGDGVISKLGAYAYIPSKHTETGHLTEAFFIGIGGIEGED